MVSPVVSKRRHLSKKPRAFKLSNKNKKIKIKQNNLFKTAYNIK